MQTGRKIGMSLLIIAIIAVSIVLQIPRVNPGLQLSGITVTEGFLKQVFRVQPDTMWPVLNTRLIISLVLLAGAFLLWLRGTLRGRFLLCIMLGHFWINDIGVGPFFKPSPMMTSLLITALWVFCAGGLTLILLWRAKNDIQDRLERRFPRVLFGIYLLIASAAVLAPWVTNVMSTAKEVLSIAARSGESVRMGWPGLAPILIPASAVLVFLKDNWGYLLFGAVSSNIFMHLRGIIVFTRLAPLELALYLAVALAGVSFAVLLFLRLGRPMGPLTLVPSDPM